MRFAILLLIPITALVGCGEPTYEGCVRDAVEDGRSEYGIEVLIDLCDQAKRKRQAHMKEQCFDSLTRNYGERAVQVYKKALGVGSCEPNADLSNKGIPRTVTKAAAKNAMIEAAVAGYETSASAAVLEEPVSDPADAAEPAPPDSEVVDYGEPVYCGSGGC